MSVSSGVEDSLKAIKKLKKCDILSEADLLEALSHIPCPEKWNVGDLHAALLAGWGEVVRAMVEVLCGYDKVLCGRQLALLLLEACFSGNLSIVKFLVLEVKCWSVHHYTYKISDSDKIPHIFTAPIYNRSDAKYNEYFDLDVAALLVAFLEGHWELVKYLTENTTNQVDALTNALLIACLNGYLELIKHLVAIAHVKPIVANCKNALYLACYGGHQKVVKYLVTDAKAPVDPNHTLHITCEKGHLGIVKYLVKEAGADPNIANDYGLNPLHFSCEKGYLDIVKYLVEEAYVDPNVTNNNYGLTPLYLACEKGHLRVVEYLVAKAHVDPNPTLFFACEKGRLDVVKYLVTEAHADPNVVKFGSTPLHLACENGHLEVVKYLIKKVYADRNDTDKYGSTPLHLACEKGHLEVVKYLVKEASANPNVTTKSGSTPLHLACEKGHLDVVKYLVKEAYADLMNNYGLTPLHFAYRNRHLYVAKYFHADINVTRKSGSTPLHLACEKGHLDVVKYLVTEARADPNVINDYSSTPLYLACEKGHFNVAEYLVAKAHVDPNPTLHIACEKGHLDVVKYLVDADPRISGSIALHLACEKGKLDIIKYLIKEVHVDPNVTNTYESTPLYLACKKRQLQDVVNSIVKEVHTDPKIRNSGSTPLHFACEKGHLDVVEYLIEVAHANPNVVRNFGSTPLHLACEKGHLNIVKCLVTAHADPKVTDILDSTPLHLACENGHLNVVKCLVTAHVDPKVTDILDSTPLHLACEKGHLDVVKYLVTEAHADPNVINDYSSTPLHLACEKGHLDVVKYLVTEAHADPNVINDYSSTPLYLACEKRHFNVAEYLVTKAHVDPYPTLCIGCEMGHLDIPKYLLKEVHLHLACEKGHLDVVKYLVEEAHADPNIKNNSGSTPLHIACKNGHFNVADYLIAEVHVNPDSTLHIACEKGHLVAVKYLVKEADPDVANNSGLTPLHFACEKGHLDVVKYLVKEAHADPNVTNNSGLTPLHFACEMGYLDVVKYLVKEAHADPNVTNYFGSTPLHFACKMGHLDVVKYLVKEAHADPNVTNNSGLTPLHFACEMGHLDVVKYLVKEAHADPNVTNNSGLTPLHFACEMGHLDVVKYLVKEAYADPNVTNNSCLTPLHFACEKQHLDIVTYLLTDAHANPNIKNNKGYTPLNLACEYGYLGIAKCLIAKGRHIDPKIKDEFGLTPLHYACTTDHPELVKWLFDIVNCGFKDSHSTLRKDDTKSASDTKQVSLYDQWLQERLNNADNSISDRDLKASLSDQWHLIQLFIENGTAEYYFIPNLKILVIGNASAGKSTLVKALQDKLNRTGHFDKFASIFRTVSGVEFKTAGIVPTTIQTESLGYITFYDLAGQCEYYSSHAAMLKNLISPLDSLVLIVVDLSQDIDKVTTSLNYWSKFISSLTAEKESKPHQQIVFTHSDLLSGSPVLRVNQLKELTSCNVEVTDYIFLNCTKASSIGLTSVHDLITNKCSKIQSELKQHKMRPSFAASNYLMSEFSADRLKLSFPLQVLLDRFDNVPLLLMKHLLHALSKQGKILFLENAENVGSSWVILDVQTLMEEVNGTIFSPENFKRHHDMSSNTGVVPLSAISKVFKNHDKNMIVDFLCHFEFCHKIASKEADLIGRSQEHFTIDESYYFFPALVRIDRPEVEFFSVQGLSYRFGWFLKSNQDGDFLFPRFLHVLVLRLAFSFALAPEPEDVDTSCPVLQRKCNVWKCGISWQNRGGVEVVVEVVEESTAVVVVVRCLEGREWAGMRLRSEVIRTVLDVKEEHAKETEMKERVVHPQELRSYPLSEVNRLLSFSMYEISCVVVDGQHVITCKKGSRQDMISIRELLFFEPYAYFGRKIISELVLEANSDFKVPEAFLNDIGESVKLENQATVQENLKAILPLNYRYLVGKIDRCDEQYKNDPAHQCYLILHTWKKYHCNPTYSALRKALDRYSMFAGRNPLVISASILTLSATEQPQ